MHCSLSLLLYYLFMYQSQMATSFPTLCPTYNITKMIKLNHVQAVKSDYFFEICHFFPFVIIFQAKLYTVTTWSFETALFF